MGWLLDSFDVMLYSIVLTTLMREFGMSKTTAGLLNTGTLVASAIGSFGFGLLADRYGRRRMLSLSILTYSIFTFLCGLSTTVGTLGVFRFLLGLGMGGEWNTGATLVAESWPAALRGRALALVQSSWALGYALAALVGGLILSRLSWRWVFFVGVIPALFTFWIQRAVPEPELWRERKTQASWEVSSSAQWRAAFPKLFALFAMNAFGMFAWWGLFTWMPAYLALPVAEGGRNFTAFGFTAFLITLNLCGMFPGYLLFGALADRIGRKRTILAYLCLAALSVPLFAVARQPLLILFSAMVTAFFGTGFFTGSGIIGAELFPTRIRSSALGISYNAARGLSACAPFVIGALGEAKGLAWGFAACGLAFAGAAISALFLPETHGTELA